MNNITTLPETFQNWSWELSNGQATIEQTQKAYAAITSQGACYDFSHLVWNDIVTLLNSALTQSGLSWDNRYSSYEEALMPGVKSPLTAKMFNSVRYNLTIYYNTWSWHTTENVKGYIGRLDFKGYSTDGEDADYLYGDYIVEITQKLALLIEYLKGEAITPEIKASITIGVIDAFVNTVEASEIIMADSIKSSINANTEIVDHIDVISENLITADILANVALFIVEDMKVDSQLKTDTIGKLSDHIAKDNVSETKITFSDEIYATNNKAESLKNVTDMTIEDTMIGDSYTSKDGISVHDHKFYSLAIGNSYDVQDMDFSQTIVLGDKKHYMSTHSIVESNSVTEMNMTIPKAALSTGYPEYFSIADSASMGYESKLESSDSKEAISISSTLFTSIGQLASLLNKGMKHTSNIVFSSNGIASSVTSDDSNILAEMKVTSVATLRTWEAPIMTENGLYIRQAYGISQTENRLEVL